MIVKMMLLLETWAHEPQEGVFHVRKQAVQDLKEDDEDDAEDVLDDVADLDSRTTRI